jgi:hypothetical protein
MLVLEEACRCLEQLDILDPLTVEMGVARVESRQQQGMRARLLDQLRVFEDGGGAAESRLSAGRSAAGGGSSGAPVARGPGRAHRPAGQLYGLV